MLNLSMGVEVERGGAIVFAVELSHHQRTLARQSIPIEEFRSLVDAQLAAARDLEGARPLQPLFDEHGEPTDDA